MSTEVKQLLLEALKLSTEDRAELATELLASLDEADDGAGVEYAWAAEIERRARRVLAGDSSGTPWEEVRDRLRRDILKR
jgi:putative addiction module component (TIGR02574 family)